MKDNKFFIKYTIPAEGFPSDSDPSDIAESISAFDDLDNISDATYDINELSWDGNILSVYLLLSTSDSLDDVLDKLSSLDIEEISEV